MRMIARPSIFSTAGRMVVVTLLMLMATFAVSCHWLRYHDLVRTHVDLMDGIASDVGDAISGGIYRLRPADLQTMAYPLERARAFLDETQGRRESLASRQRLEEFVDAYQELYEYLDRVRTLSDDAKGGDGEQVNSRRAKKVDALIAAVSRRAAATRAALDAETV